ncbi:MAG: GntR family transcriptional regulator [Alphaproteobacteria bacterium]|nr:GntR family transcriptional regulator [Alphaproteobacteria bacterium]
MHFELPNPEPRRETLQDLAYRQLVDALMSGRIPPGRRMTNRGLAEMLGVSVTPVREALHRLISEQALVSLPNGSVVVPELTSADIAEMHIVARELEGIAVAEAARQMSAREVLRAKKTWCKLGESIAKGEDAETLSQLTYRYCSMIFAGARMPYLFGMIQRIWMRQGPHIYVFFPEFTRIEAREKLVARLFDALERKDPDQARALHQQKLDLANEWWVRRAEEREQLERARKAPLVPIA